MTERMTPPAIDHVGLVVADVERVVGEMREHGLRVSDPEPLQAEDGPMGQISAHCVFPNGYLEISAPIPGSDNHLEPLLAEGAGWKILVFACSNCEAEREKLASAGFDCGLVAEASRKVTLSDGQKPVRFRWFSLPDLIDGVLVAYVEHLDRDVVFDPRLARHSCGAIGLKSVVFGRGSERLSTLPSGEARSAPEAKFCENSDVPIVGIEISGGRVFNLAHDSWELRASSTDGEGDGA